MSQFKPALAILILSLSVPASFAAAPANAPIDESAEVTEGSTPKLPNGEDVLAPPKEVPKATPDEAAQTEVPTPAKPVDIKEPKNVRKSSCVREYNANKNNKEKLHCVSSVEELKYQLLGKKDPKYTKLGFTTMKYFNIPMSDVMDAVNNGKELKLDLKYEPGLSMDECTVGFGRSGGGIIDGFKKAICRNSTPRVGYSEYKSKPGEGGITPGKYNGQDSFVTSFKGRKVPVSVCLRESKEKTYGGIKPGPQIVAMVDIPRNFPNREYIGHCAEIITGPVDKKNRVGKPEGTIMQAVRFPMHPKAGLRKQEALRLFPIVPRVGVNERVAASVPDAEQSAQ